MKRNRRIHLVLIVLLCLGMIAGCGTPPKEADTQKATTAPASPKATVDAVQDNTGDDAKTPDRVTLEFLAPSPVSQINDFDAVLAKVYEMTDATLNVRINYTFTTFDDIGQKTSLKMSSGEQLDCVFVAQWTNPSMAQMVSKGMLVNLDPYIESADYPALQQYFSGEYRNNNVVMDANGESHLYALPYTRTYGDGKNIFYRKDLATKYGFGEINDYDTLTAFYDAILENEQGMTPFCFLGANEGISEMLKVIHRSSPQTTQHNTLLLESTYGVVVGDDGLAYVAKTVVPEMDPEYHKRLPQHLQDEDPLLGYKLAREWYLKGYLEKDNLSQKDYEGQFMAGRAASYPRAVDIFVETELRLKGAIQGAELGHFTYDPGIRYGTAKASGSDFRAWNFSAIPSTSKYADRTMGFMNWIFESRENHDLLEFGIEGTHWVAVGDDSYYTPEDVDPNANYNFYGYILTWNPQMVRYDSGTPEDIVTIYKNLADADFYYKRMDAGFSFVTDSIKTEQAKINDLKSLMRALGCGVIDDIEGEVAKIQAQYDQAGFQIVVEELEKQFNAFLKEHPYNGQ